MKVKKSYLKLTVLLSGIVLVGVVALSFSTNASAINDKDYMSLKNGVELQSEILALNSPDTDLKCGGDEGEKKCGEGKDGEKKCGEGKDGDKKCGEGKDDEKKCGEGKCGGGDTDAEAKSEKKAEAGDEKCGEGKCGEGESKTE